MSSKILSLLRIAGSVLCFWGAALLLNEASTKEPRAVQILTSSGTALLGVLLLVQRMAPAWVQWCLFTICLIGLWSDDFYRTFVGLAHWDRLLVPIGILLLVIFNPKRHGDRA